jgi:hypothetical protein
MAEPIDADDRLDPRARDVVPYTSRRARPGACGVRSTKTSASFHPRLPFEQWRDLGTKLATYSNATSWWLGDWLAFGQRQYGRQYRQAIAATGLDYQTLRNYTVVARRFEPARRRADVTFQHHAELCALPDDAQDAWLARAAAEGWSRNELRRHVRAGRDAAGETVETVRLAVGRRQLQRWREAAQRSDCSLDGWLVGALDRAAAALEA